MRAGLGTTGAEDLHAAQIVFFQLRMSANVGDLRRESVHNPRLFWEDLASL